MKRLQRLTIWLSLLLALAGALALAAVATARPVPDGPAVPQLPQVSCTGSNLLQNPSFEGQYSSYIPPDGHPDCEYGICTTAQMAPGWTPYWLSQNPSNPDIRMPEYKPADPFFTDPPRVRSGSAAQQYFTFFATHEAGILQQVPVAPGSSYYFSIWGHSWSADDNDDAYSGPDHGNLRQRTGIDPTGGSDWLSPAIAWNAERLQYDIYGLFTISATAQADTLTVYAYSVAGWPVEHNDVYWDDACLVERVLAPPPSAQLLSFADPAAPQTFTHTLPINISGEPGLSWTASLAPTGTLTATLSAVSGLPGETLAVTIDSSGYPTGTYSTTLIISSHPAVPGSPLTLPVVLRVTAQVDRLYLPLALRP